MISRPFEPEPSPRASGIVLPMVAVLAGVALTGLLDRLTGDEFGFSVFYLLPVAWAALWRGTGAGMLAAFAAAVAWFLAQRRDGYAHEAAPYWNAAIRLCFFALGVGLVRVWRNMCDERSRRLAAEAVSRLKSGMAGMMGPESRLILDEMEQAVDRLRKEDPSLPHDDRELDYGLLGESIGRLRRIVQSVQDWRVLDSATFQIELSKPEVEPLVREASTVLVPLLRGREVSVQLDFSPRKTEVRAETHPAELEQVVAKLVETALRVTPAPSPLVLRVVEESGDPSRLRLVVETGQTTAAASRLARALSEATGPGNPTPMERSVHIEVARGLAGHQSIGLGTS